MARRLDVCDLANGTLSMKPVGENDFQVQACDAP